MTQRLDRISAGLVLGAMVLTAAALIGLYDRNLINPDSIQLVDAARHLLAGDGFSTSIILYESQLQFGHVPAPLTVWPPGLSWLVLLPMKLGLSGEAAAFALCVIGHLATTWLIFMLAHRYAGPRIAAVAAIAWLLHSIALMMVLAMYAEPVFIAFTVASYFALIEAGRDGRWSTRWLLIAGAAAAWAILMRYSGVLWPAAAGLWLLWMSMRDRNWQPIRAAFIFGALPALTTVALFLRNLLLTGRFSGGQFEYGGPGGVIVVARHLLWDSNMILGRLLRLSPVVFALVVGTLIVAIVLAARRSRTSAPRDAAVGLAISSTLVLVAFLVGNAIQSSLVFVDYRYWLPAVPFLAVLLSVVAHEAIVAVPRHSFLPQSMWPAAVVASCALLTLSVLAALPERWPIRTAHPTVAVVEQALAQRMPDGRTVREAVTTGDLNKPVLAHLEQRFYAQTGRAVVGLINASYTKRVWTKHEVKELVEQYGIEQVVLFPQAFQPNLAENKNQQFWNELLGGQLPPWLQPHYVSANVVLYDVIQSELRQTE